MNLEFLKAKAVGIAFILFSLSLVAFGTFTQHVATLAEQFDHKLGDVLFWSGLAILAIPFIATEFRVAKNEDDIKQLKVDMKNLKNEIEALKKPVPHNETQPIPANSIEKEVSRKDLLQVESALKKHIGGQYEKLQRISRNRLNQIDLSDPGARNVSSSTRRTAFIKSDCVGPYD